jgi:hypothetical protein
MYWSKMKTIIISKKGKREEESQSREERVVSKGGPYPLCCQGSVALQSQETGLDT